MAAAADPAPPQDNCGKCAQLAPFVGELSESHPGVAFVHVSTSTAGPLAAAAQAAGCVVGVPRW